MCMSIISVGVYTFFVASWLCIISLSSVALLLDDVFAASSELCRVVVASLVNSPLNRRSFVAFVFGSKLTLASKLITGLMCFMSLTCFSSGGL